MDFDIILGRTMNTSSLRKKCLLVCISGPLKRYLTILTPSHQVCVSVVRIVADVANNGTFGRQVLQILQTASSGKKNLTMHRDCLKWENSLNKVAIFGKNGS